MFEQFNLTVVCIAPRWFNLLALLALLALSSVSTIRAADITVDESCTLADAIDAANTDLPQGDCLAGDGADVIFLSENVILSAELPHILTEISIEGNGFYISGDLSHRIFSVGGSALTLNHVTIREGRSRSGSAIYAWNATIAINGSVLEGNVAYASILGFGGAIHCWPCNLDIRNSVLQNNTASGNGGAIYFSACCDDSYTLRISNSIIEKNNAGDGGAGIYIGGLHPLQTATIANSTFAGNWAAGDGGGIWRSGHPEELSERLIVENSSFHHNAAYEGDAIYLDRHTVNTLQHVTLAHNDGYSIYIDARSITHLVASIIARDSRNSLCFGVPSVIAHTMIEDGSCDPPLEGDAMLGELFEPADGSSAYFPLAPDSPAVDAVECDESVPTDQIGTPRPQGARCDIGAIEFVPDTEG